MSAIKYIIIALLIILILATETIILVVWNKIDTKKKRLSLAIHSRIRDKKRKRDK